jgi:hypothetical protein
MKRLRHPHEEVQVARAPVLREIAMDHAVRALLVLLLLTVPAFGFDHDFDHTTERSKFFGLLKRPDFYPKSCCGEADAYEADIYQKNPDGSYVVIITDGSAIEYPDGAHRDYIANGTKVIVPSKRSIHLSKPITIRPATPGCS